MKTGLLHKVITNDADKSQYHLWKIFVQKNQKNRVALIRIQIILNH